MFFEGEFEQEKVDYMGAIVPSLRPVNAKFDMTSIYNGLSGYGGGVQGNRRNRGPPPNDSTDAMIEAISSKVLTKPESTELGVNKMHEELCSLGKMVESNSWSGKWNKYP
ncbi:hypothetical protein HAX54_048418 [Datura stramonium]|uniref:Uncharacterized protein n=1 Tax=Datura stramonium TaxID=4076 RepID=A0ABS8SVC5_DATST|nr:hypothetical protein [Datura stramonium]